MQTSDLKTQAQEKALVAFICERKEESSKEENPKNAPTSDEKEKSQETKTDDKQEKKEEAASADRDEKHKENSDDEKISSDESKDENGDAEKSEDDGKSEKDAPVEVKVADVSMSSPNGAVNPDEQKNEENIQMWSPGDNNVF